jgi:hypothetical protein
MKNSNGIIGNRTATFRFVAQCLNPCPQCLLNTYSAQALLHYSITKHPNTLKAEIFVTVKPHNLACWFINPRSVVPQYSLEVDRLPLFWASTQLTTVGGYRQSSRHHASRIPCSFVIYCPLHRRKRLSCLTWTETCNTRDDVGGKHIRVYCVNNMSLCQCKKQIIYNYGPPSFRCFVYNKPKTKLT